MRDPEERDAEQRALGILEHGLTVTHDPHVVHDLHVTHDGQAVGDVEASKHAHVTPDRLHVRVPDEAGRNALTEWRLLSAAAEKNYQAEARGRRRRPREYSSKRRLRWLWAIPLILIWAAAAVAVYLLLNGGQI